MMFRLNKDLINKCNFVYQNWIFPVFYAGNHLVTPKLCLTTPWMLDHSHPLLGENVICTSVSSKVVERVMMMLMRVSSSVKRRKISVWQRKRERASAERCLGELLFVFAVFWHVTVGRHTTGSVWTSPHLPSQHIPPFTASQRNGKMARVKRKTDSNISQSFGCWDLIG